MRKMLIGAVMLTGLAFGTSGGASACWDDSYYYGGYAAPVRYYTYSSYSPRTYGYYGYYGPRVYGAYYGGFSRPWAWW